MSGLGRSSGIRVDGELMAFTTGIRAVAPDSTPLAQPNLERLAYSRFSRDGNKLICSGSLSPVSGSPAGGGRGRGPARGVNGRVVYEDAGPGLVNVDVQVTANADTALAGTYFFIHLPGAEYSGASAQLLNATPTDQPPAKNRYPGGSARGVRFTSPRRQLEVAFAAPEDIAIKPGRGGQNDGIDVYFPINMGNLTNGQSSHLNFTLKASGDVDKTPVKLTIDPAHPGDSFDGVGGNFRIQSRADPPQVQYNLDHLRVAWGRVNMPLDQWQPNEDNDPLQVTNASQLNAGVREAMEMARTLARRNIPIVISLWSAPRWALSLPRDAPG